MYSRQSPALLRVAGSFPCSLRDGCTVFKSALRSAGAEGADAQRRAETYRASRRHTVFLLSEPPSKASAKPKGLVRAPSFKESAPPEALALVCCVDLLTLVDPKVFTTSFLLSSHFFSS